MSKPVKEMIMAEYQRRFDGLEGALVIDIRGIEANENNGMRLGLAKHDIRVTVLKNTLARRAFAGTSLEAVGPALDGPTALAYGAESVVDVARQLVEWAKKVKNLELRGAVLDGEYFDGEAGVKELSTFPTRPEALSRAVQIVLSPARNVVGCTVSPGAKLLGIVKEIQERLEKGTSIEAV